MDTLKQCTKCKEQKPATLEYFLRDKRRENSIGSWCRACWSAHGKQRRAENPEKALEKERASKARLRAENPEKIREQQRAASARKRAKNPEKTREQDRARHARQMAENPEKVREQGRIKRARQRAKNPERIREQNRASHARQMAENPERIRERNRASHARRMAENPEKVRAQKRASQARQAAKKPEKVRERNRLTKMKLWREQPERMREESRIRASRREARKRSLPDTLTKQNWLYAVTWWAGCAYCGADLPAGKLTLDHVIPLVSPDCPGTVAGNIVPACKSCNSSKHTLPVEQFLERKFGQAHAANRLAIIADFFNTLPDDD